MKRKKDEGDAIDTLPLDGKQCSKQSKLSWFDDHWAGEESTTAMLSPNLLNVSWLQKKDVLINQTLKNQTPDC